MTHELKFRYVYGIRSRLVADKFKRNRKHALSIFILDLILDAYERFKYRQFLSRLENFAREQKQLSDDFQSALNKLHEMKSKEQIERENA